MTIKLKTIETPPGWEPAFKLNLDIAGPGAFRQLLDDLKAWSLTHPPTLSWETGWYTVTPYMSEDLAKRTSASGNRKVSFEGVKKYARQMVAGDWVMTGETAVLDEKGGLRDAGHRILAGLLSGASFPVFVVTDVPAHPDLSSRIDSGISRTPADALFMAGCDNAAQVASAIAIAHRYDNDKFTVTKSLRINSLTNTEVVEYYDNHSGLNEAARIALATHKKAVEVIGHKGIAVFVAWKIREQFGEQGLEEFMSPLGSGANLNDNDPVLALRERLQKLDEDKSGNDTPQRLAYVIKAFNMHRLGQTVRLTGRNSGLILATNESFPRFEELEMEDAAQ